MNDSDADCVDGDGMLSMIQLASFHSTGEYGDDGVFSFDSSSSDVEDDGDVGGDVAMRTMKLASAFDNSKGYVREQHT